MPSIGRQIRDLTGLYETSRSYRLIVVIIAALTLVPLVLGLIEGIRVGGSALGYVVWFAVTVGVTGLLLGIALWGVAMIWYRSAMP